MRKSVNHRFPCLFEKLLRFIRVRTKSFTVLYLKASPPSSIAVEKENVGGRGGEQWLSTPLMTCSTQRSALLLPSKQWGEMTQHWNTKPGSTATESVVTVVEYILPHNNSYEKRRKRGRERRKKLHCPRSTLGLIWLWDSHVMWPQWGKCFFTNSFVRILRLCYLLTLILHRALHLYKKSYINVRHAYVNYPNRII